MPTNGSDTDTEVPNEGDLITHERTITIEDVREFAEVSGNQQLTPTESDDEGRATVPELLIGSLMTKIGSDIRYLARTVELDFRREINTDELITCEWTVESKEERDDRYLLENTVVYYDENGDIVGTGNTTGIVWK